MAEQGTQEAPWAFYGLGSKPRSLVVKDVLQYLFGRDGGDTIGAVRAGLGIEFGGGMRLYGIMSDLVALGVLVHRPPHRVVHVAALRYCLSATTWLQLVREKQGEPECVGA